MPVLPYTPPYVQFAGVYFDFASAWLQEQNAYTNPTATWKSLGQNFDNPPINVDGCFTQDNGAIVPLTVVTFNVSKVSLTGDATVFFNTLIGYINQQKAPKVTITGLYVM
jgi:hypothetical protein